VEYKRESGAECAQTHIDDIAGDVCMCVLGLLGCYCMCDYYNIIEFVID